MLRLLVRIVLTYAGFLEFSSDDELDPDTAVKQLEDLAATLLELDARERAVFVALLRELAEEEETAAGKQWVLDFPGMVGLAE